jgi:ParB-like chromosome segregation protein Spo0J
VHEPLLVRCRMVDATATKTEDMFDGYELVFGHRRLRAAKLANLATVPCMVRTMTDAEVRSAQAAENLQRENISALEEAQGYQQMAIADGLSAEWSENKVNQLSAACRQRGGTTDEPCADGTTAGLRGLGAEAQPKRGGEAPYRRVGCGRD